MKDPQGKSLTGVPVKARATITNNNHEQQEFKFQGHLNEIRQISSRDGAVNFVCNIPHDAERAEFTVSKHLQC